MSYLPLLFLVLVVAVLFIASTPPMRTSWNYRAAWMLCVVILVLALWAALTHRWVL